MRSYFAKILLIVGLVGLFLAGRRLSNWPIPTFPSAGAETQGHFETNGFYPAPGLDGYPSLRKWGSWAGSDDNEGSFALEPFLMPPQLTVFVCGDPFREGNSVHIEDAKTNERLEFVPVSEPGLRWHPISIVAPKAWIGRSVRLVATDGSKGLGGWLGLTEPVADWPFHTGRLLSTLGVAGMVMIVFGGLLMPIAAWAERKTGAMPALSILIAIAAVAILGELIATVYFLHPMLGRFLSTVSILVGTFVWLKRRPPMSPESLQILILLTIISVFYISITFLYNWTGDLYSLAAARFRPELPMDNYLPHIVAERLYDGTNLRELIGDWHISDRPPLQTGILLITYPLANWLGDGIRLISAVTAFLFQISWVAAAYALLRLLKLSQCLTSAIVITFSLSGFFIQNTVYTWPKLSAATFCAGAFIVLVQRKGSLWDSLTVSALISLAWLSHGGIAFSLLPLGLWILYRIWKAKPTGLHLAAMIVPILLLVMPWIAFQKLYDPPGDRLLKWHLAGQIPPDNRSAWTAIGDAYRDTPWKDLIEARLANLRLQVDGHWTEIAKYTKDSLDVRQQSEFTIPLRALAWWPICVCVLLSPAFWQSEKNQRSIMGMRGELLVWTVLSYLIWIALMFLPNNALIHQGSYMSQLGLFVLLGSLLRSAKWWVVVLIFAFQSYTFITNYCIPCSPMLSQMSQSALWLAVSMFTIYLGILFRYVRHTSD